METEIDSEADLAYAIGFRKAFIQDVDQSATRLS